MQKKIVVGDYTDPNTGIRFIEDDRGNYHIIQHDQNTEPNNISISVDARNPFETENKRLIRVMEKLRSENSWLYEIIENSKVIWKRQTPKKAMEYLEKSLNERQR